MSERWLSLAEIPAYLGVSRDSVYRWVGDHGMPAHKVSRQWKFRCDEGDARVRRGQADIMTSPADRKQAATPRASRSIDRP